MRNNAQKVLAIGFLILAFAFFINNSTQKARALGTHNVSGQAWSSNIGWISFSCDDTSSCGTINYGVDVDPNTGQISGTAWNNNLGWVRFDPNNSQTYAGPSGGGSPAYVDANGNLIGWARVCGGMDNLSLNQANVNNACTNQAGSRTDGWDGWISLSSASGVTYGAKFNTATGTGSGQAWGSDIVGWIDFSGVKLDKTLPTVSLTANPTSVFTGNPSNLSWTTTNATSCTASGGWSGSKATSGTSVSTGALSATTTFTLTCTNANGSASGSATVTVTTPPSPTVSTNSPVTAITSTSACLPGGTLNINGSTNVPMTRYVEWSPNSNMSGNGTLNAGPTSVSGSYNPWSCTISGLSPNTTYYYRATVVDSVSAKFTGSTLSFTTLSAVPAPTIDIKFDGYDGYPNTVVSPNYAGTLSWTSTNFAANSIPSCTLYGNGYSATWPSGGTVVGINGSASSGPITTNNTVFNLICTSTVSPFTSVSDQVQLYLKSLTLTANPTTLATGGGNTTLTWTSSAVGNCKTISNPTASGWDSSNKTLSGSQTVSITKSTTFGISCDNGTISAQASVTVGGVTPPSGPTPPKKPKWWEF